MGCKFDLVYAASSLQYVENWQKLIENFIELGPKYILLSDVFAGNINSYVSLQNYYGSKIPHWFLSLKEVLAIFEISGYKMIMKSYATSRRLAFEDFLPMNNFPTELQLPQTLNLLFHKICDE
jgi:putative methyltransferase (TIGR04325 family)